MSGHSELARRLRNIWPATRVCQETLAEAADALDAMGQQKPAAWVVVTDEGPDFVARDRQTCHEHINSAINDFAIEGAEKWVVRPVYLQPAQPQERGPWQVDQWSDGRIVVQSDDFTHDVALVVTGDFADIEQRRAYAHMLAERLNAQPQEQREPTLSEKLREAGFTRRPSWRSLPSDSMDDEPTEAQIGTCFWSTADDDTDVWETSCGHAFTINEGTPTDNQMTFCCYCGKRVEEDAANAAKESAK